MTARILSALLLLLLTPAAVQAKEIVSVSICGASECTNLTPRTMASERLHLLVEAVGEAEPPAAGAPWYRVKVRGRGEGERFGYTLAYVPSEGLVRGLRNAQPTWSSVLPKARPIFTKLTAGLKPLPAERLTGLDIRPPQAQVAEVFSPARDTAAQGAGGGPPWAWIVAALTAAITAVALRRRRAQPSV